MSLIKRRGSCACISIGRGMPPAPPLVSAPMNLCTPAARLLLSISILQQSMTQANQSHGLAAACDLFPLRCGAMQHKSEPSTGQHERPPLEEGVVAGTGHLSGAVLEQHRALAERGGSALQRGVHLGRIRVPQPPALPLHPPAESWPVMSTPETCSDTCTDSTYRWADLPGAVLKGARKYYLGPPSAVRAPQQGVREVLVTSAPAHQVAHCV